MLYASDTVLLRFANAFLNHLHLPEKERMLCTTDENIFASEKKKNGVDRIIKHIFVLWHMHSASKKGSPPQ